MAEYIDIGVIVNTHGIKGHIKVKPLTGFPERFSNMKGLLVQNNKGKIDEYTIEDVKYHKDMILIKLKEIDNMNEVEVLKGLKIVVERADLVKLPENSYYIFDLIDCKVYENEEFLGEVKDVIETGSNDVYVVKNEDRQILIPALSWVVLSVDTENKRIEVKLPKGLLDI